MTPVRALMAVVTSLVVLRTAAPTADSAPMVTGALMSPGARPSASASIVARTATAASPASQVFRASTDVVTVDVSVRRGNRPLTGLGIQDFEILDDGVTQRIVEMSYEKLPVDVTAVLDVSSSVTGEMLQQLRMAVVDIRRRLQSGDRLRLVTFNMRIRRVVDITASPQALDVALQSLRSGGSSAVNDALSVALVAANAPNRRQFIVLFSDGRDSASITGAEAVLDVARRTSATVHVVLAASVKKTIDTLYTSLASLTGGAVHALLPGDTVGGAFDKALEQFRSSYVLTYSPGAGLTPGTGVRQGPHAISVRVRRDDVDVRARQTYVVP